MRAVLVLCLALLAACATTGRTGADHEHATAELRRQYVATYRHQLTPPVAAAIERGEPQVGMTREQAEAAAAAWRQVGTSANGVAPARVEITRYRRPLGASSFEFMAISYREGRVVAVDHAG